MVVTWVASSVDLYPEQVGVSLADVRTFRKDLGGSATNVAVAAARLGRRSAVITKVGDDGFGLYVHQTLRSFGVYDGWVGTDPVSADTDRLLRGQSAGPGRMIFCPPTPQGAGAASPFDQSWRGSTTSTSEQLSWTEGCRPTGP